MVEHPYVPPAPYHGWVPLAQAFRAIVPDISLNLLLAQSWGFPVSHWNTVHGPPWLNWTAYETHLTNLVRLLRSNGISGTFEVWNEPDIPDFWNGTDAQFHETYRRAHAIIRAEVGASADVGGPSFGRYDRARIQAFLEFCLASGCEVNVLIFHTLDDTPEGLVAAVADAREARTAFLENPRYAPLRMRRIVINEIVGPTYTRQPAGTLAHYAAFEHGGAAAAARGCWPTTANVSECFDGSLDGLLTTGTLLPRSVWWAHKFYADGVATRVASTVSSPNVIALASREAETPLPQVLIGHVDFGRTINKQAGSLSSQLVMTGIASIPRLAGARRVTLRVESVPDTGEAALAAPVLVSTQLVDVVGDRVQVSLPPMGVGEVLRLTVQPGDPDSDGDGLPDWWEQRSGLNPNAGSGDDGPSGDPDSDGVSNLAELQNGSHPRGFFTRYLAEGATSAFFDTTLALVNPSTTPALALLRFLQGDGTSMSYDLAVPARTRRTLNVKTDAQLAQAEFSTVVETDVQLVIDRTMTWDAGGYGSHAETSIASPATIWYLAEGATHSGFDLFYLIQNANDEQARLRVKYLLPSGSPIEKDYTVGARSRFNLWVDTDDPRLESTDVSAVITSDRPIIVERAMYLSSGRLFQAGHESAAIAAPATEWFLAEGATGDFFDLFVLVANPSDTDAAVRATFLLPSGETLVKHYTVAANTRFNIWVDTEDERLADTAVSTIVTSTNLVPLVVERAMWWPGPTASTWTEAHNSAGSTATGTVWALAEGAVGGARDTRTYILVASTSAMAADVRVTLLFEDGRTSTRTFAVPGHARFNVDVGAEFPVAAGQRFGAIVESENGAPIVVERAMYSDEGGITWAAGTNALATRLR